MYVEPKEHNDDEASDLLLRQCRYLRQIFYKGDTARQESSEHTHHNHLYRLNEDAKLEEPVSIIFRHDATYDLQDILREFGLYILMKQPIAKCYLLMKHIFRLFQQNLILTELI